MDPESSSRSSKPPPLPKYDVLREDTTKNFSNEDYILKSIRLQANEASRRYKSHLDERERHQSIWTLSLILLGIVTVILGVVSTTMTNNLTEDYKSASIKPDHIELNQFLKSHRSHAPEGPSDLSELENSKESLQSFQSVMSQQLPEDTTLHKPATPADDAMRNLGSHVKMQTTANNRAKANTGFMIASLVMGCITGAVAVWNWHIQSKTKAMESDLEQWEFETNIAIGYAELQNKVLEDKRKQEAEEEATERFLGFSNAVKQMNNSIVNAVKGMEDREKESFTILKNLEAAAAEKQQEGDEMFARIVQALEAAMKERKRGQEQVLGVVSEIQILLEKEGRAGEDNTPQLALGQLQNLMSV
ncbi:hypothetical protein EYR41_011096 [Orbilia oligospora]|uniref:Transmembrane protein n=1 Tax=Orbilia oligospora TaxID=2813651 RepID=A0A8H2DK40_ORBOL|nr:hypothetical protein EYR41_011096 [Orbilia oligospora]